MRRNNWISRQSGLARMMMLSIAALAAISACGMTDEEEVSTQPGKSLSPVATAWLPSGNAVEFYDLKGRVLVSEVGTAYTAPALGRTTPRGGTALEIWNALSPSVPPPEALVALQERAASTPRPADSLRRTEAAQPKLWATDAPIENKPVGEVDPGLLAAPQGCNNGCCDPDWLPWICGRFNRADHNWFWYNAGYSGANFGGIGNVTATVCSASGPSYWHINLDNDDHYFTVNEATYRVFDWQEMPGWFGEDFTSSVNFSWAQHQHMYCGSVIED